MTLEALAKEIFQIVGPATNIIKAENCMTRLRLELKDQTTSMLQKLKSLDGILGIHENGIELQIILGPGRATTVTTYFKALLQEQEKNEESGESSLDNPSRASWGRLTAHMPIGDGKALQENIKKRNSTPTKLLLKRVANIFISLIPAFIACGLVTGILNIVLKTFPELAVSPLASLLALMGGSVFFAMNILVGVNAAKEFGGSPMLGGTLAAIISHPGLAAISFEGFELAPGRGGIIAVLLVAIFAAWLEKKLHQVIPEILDLFLTPLLVLLTAGFVAIFLLQPFGGILAAALHLGRCAVSAVHRHAGAQSV